MNTTIANNKIPANAHTVTFNEEKQAVKKKSDSLEFLGGVLYIVKKVFLFR